LQRKKKVFGCAKRKKNESVFCFFFEKARFARIALARI
jgi:hypothetical protein